MDHPRRVDRARLARAEDGAREDLLDEDLGEVHARIFCINKGPGGENPFHAHDWDQVFYVLSGRLMIEVEGDEPFEAGPDSLVFYPKGQMHRNWNATEEPVLHLSINVSALDGA